MFENSVFLNEAYYGKTPNIQKMENLVANLCSIAKTSPKQIHTNSTVTALEELIKKTFNFSSVIINITGDASNLDAYTIPFFNGDQIKSKKDLMIDDNKKGIKFRTPDGKEVLVTFSIYAFLNLPPKEIMFILLHEIGHNFFIAPSSLKGVKTQSIALRYISRFNKLNRKYIESKKQGRSFLSGIFIAYNLFMILALIIGFLGLMFAPSREDENGKIKDFKLLLDQIKKRSLINFNRDYERTTNDKAIKDTAKRVVKNAKKITGDKEVSLAKMYKKVKSGTNFRSNEKERYGYNAEKFCDAFAASFGYSKGINSLTRLNSKVADEVAKTDINVMRDLLIGQALEYFSDPHPSVLFRVNNVKKKLEFELNTNKNLTPGLKADIRKQIAELNELIKNDSKDNSLAIEVNKTLNEEVKYDELKDKTYGDVKDEDLYDNKDGYLKDFVKESNK